MSQKWYKKAGVQTAFVTGIFVVIAAMIAVFFGRSDKSGGMTNTAAISNATNVALTQVNSSSNVTVNNSSPTITQIAHTSGNNSPVLQVGQMTVLITNSSQPFNAKLEWSFTSTNVKAGDVYYTKVHLKVMSPYPIANLLCVASPGKNIEEIWCGPSRGGMSYSGLAGHSGDFYFYNQPNINGDWDLNIRSKIQEEYRLEFKME